MVLRPEIGWLRDGILHRTYTQFGIGLEMPTHEESHGGNGSHDEGILP